MAHVRERSNYSNQRIHSYEKMSKMIVNLGSMKGKNNDKSSYKLTCLQNILLMNIINTSEIGIYPMLIGNMNR